MLRKKILHCMLLFVICLPICALDDKPELPEFFEILQQEQQQREQERQIRQFGHMLMRAIGVEDGEQIIQFAHQIGTVDFIDDQGNAPLTYAVEMGKYNAVEVLINVCHADINFCDESGCTPLGKALYWNNHRMTELLLKKRASPNLPAYEGKTPLMVLTDENIALAKQLLNAGALINLQDNDGNTALHHALLTGNFALAAYFLKHSANVHRLNKQNLSVLDIIKTIVSRAKFPADKIFPEKFVTALQTNLQTSLRTR